MKARSKVDQRVTGVLDWGAARRRRLRTRLIAVIASAVAASALSAGTAQAATVTVFPNNPNPTGTNCFPFGIGTSGADQWPPFAAFIYQNVPSFELNTGDTLAFDTNAVNDADIELDIELARTVTNGTIVQGEPFQQVVSNDQTPQNPRGDTTVGNFDLQFTAEAPFSFPGGGLIIRFSDPSASYAVDNTCTGNLVYGNSTDASAFFIRRAYGDPDGVFPWSAQVFPVFFIGAFQVVTADPTPPEPPPNPQPPPSPPGTPPPEPLTLDLGAKKQKVKKKVKFSATANVASTLVAEGKKIKEGTTQLAANQKTTIKAKLKRKARNRFEEKGKGKVKVEGSASTPSGVAATDTVKVKLKD
jgi:hypothetical protein